jgi:tRNA nucleotidyltransferase (CCA-adding enzyme)
MRRPALPEVLSSLPGASAALVRAVLEQADAKRICVHLVGGPVRDLLLGRAVRDVDLLVEAWEGGGALDLARAVAAPELQATAHDRFGTVTLRGEKAEIDLATVRREAYAHDGALPMVEPGSLEEDLRRRDFTVNALALPLSAAARARRAGIVDVEEGLADLEQRRILHPRSFHDDPTRALRAARLAPRLGFSVTRDTRSALRSALRDGAFGRVSGERLRREIVKLFEDAALGLDPARALRLLGDWHVLGALEPGLGVERAAAAPLRRIGRAVVEAPWQAGRWRPWISGLAVWLATLPPALRRRALQRFAVRGEQARRISEFPKARDAWLRGLARARGRGAIDAVLTGVDEESLHALHAWAPPALRRRIGRWAGEDRGRRLPVTGSDLVEVGLSGPAVGRALLRIRTAYLDGALRTREEALALALELSRGRGARRTRPPKTQPRR